MNQLLTIKEATKWAAMFLQRQVSTSNISYLIQYGRIRKFGENGEVLINIADLENYYKSHYHAKEDKWKKRLGNDLNWALSFSEYMESETTKHVHRLHPYKGKFIPQLVEYFLDSHIDNFKKETYFKKGDIILDPFCGSGTTLVQCNELGMHAIGIDISAFNSLISNIKVENHDLQDVAINLQNITKELKKFQIGKNNTKFEEELLHELKLFNDKFFPAPEYRRKIRQNEINEREYSKIKEKEFLKIYDNLIEKHQIPLKQKKSSTFLEKWYLQVVRDEIDFVFEQIKKVKNPQTKKVLAIILSRTIRSCRATTHSDLGSLREPIITTYYCKKHGKICKPLFSIFNWLDRYGKDTINRLNQFDRLRTNTYQKCLTGDSRTIDIFLELKKKNRAFGELAEKKKIKGVFSSPPYVGLIDYHEQHAYAYDLFGFNRKDELEIGRLYDGQGQEARESYIKGISEVLNNCKKYMQCDYDIFLVANDKYGLYPKIAELAGMKIVNQYKRPVLNRVEKDRSAYAEIIFHLKER
ncbi:MAG: DNA methyltransferase [Candidatus Caldatribacteriota bacterium]|nr:DNA methyltransferase [Candidatus Caldatribacteriota bacterium]